MTDKEQDVPCAICYGNLTIPMSKKEMADLLKTLIDRKLNLISFPERNAEMTAIDRAKRIHELSSQAVEASVILEQITSESAQES
ncbi:hypothetical protein HMPREF9439_01005 [Parasutterella excrementihominis YIT 11859]|jgi:hypothetical protein|uniref:Uncharacterized protein n=1 Tax=Parasutterella excrementihominis YIT 11859 TaxID=762966 RepID=F3QJA4_9BURK|nr:hypothetical protein [Parasutterella excrementihominis]EGG55752.1 hypothetical protein HMPREF9439_01005 [Parasutterella excrementihominis YIT 11859]